MPLGRDHKAHSSFVSTCAWQRAFPTGAGAHLLLIADTVRTSGLLGASMKDLKLTEDRHGKPGEANVCL